MDIFLFGGALIQILILVGIICLVVWLFRHRSSSGEDPGIGTLRRFYFLRAGFCRPDSCRQRGGSIVGPGPGPAVRRRYYLPGTKPAGSGVGDAPGGSAGVVPALDAGPARGGKNPLESQAVARRVYIYLVLAVCAVVAAVGMVSLFRWWLSLDSFNGRHLLCPWFGVWFGRITGGSGTRNNPAPRLMMLSGRCTSISLPGTVLQCSASVWGLSCGDSCSRCTVPGLALGLWCSATRGYGPTPWFGRQRQAIVGAIWWWWHWHLIARTDAGSTVRQFYLHLFTILPGAGGVFVYSTILLYRVIQWELASQTLPPTSNSASFRKPCPECWLGLRCGAITGRWRIRRRRHWVAFPTPAGYTATW